MPHPPAAIRLLVLSSWLLVSGRAFTVETGQAAKPNETKPKESKPNESKPSEPALFRFFLSDGSRVIGRFSVRYLECDTEFGRLQVPIERLNELVTGMHRRPERMAEIQQLCRRLGEPEPQRTDARAELVELGPSIRPLLRQQRDDAAGNLQAELDSLLEQLDGIAEATGLPDNPSFLPLDTVRTARFTALGRLSPEKFKIETRYGDLTVTLADVEHAERSDGRGLTDAGRSLEIDGTNFVQTAFKSSGIEVLAGDRIVVRAKGTLSRGVGKGFSTTPDGSSRFGTFSQTPPILGGALVARIGPSGQVIRVGSNSSFVVKQSGLLQFAIAMRTELVGRYQFTGKYDVTVKVLRGKGR